MCMNSQGTRRALLPRGPKGDRDPEPKPEPPRLAFSQGGGRLVVLVVRISWLAMALWLVAVCYAP